MTSTRFRRIAGAVLVTVALTGCAASEDDDAPDETETEAETEGEGDEGGD